MVDNPYKWKRVMQIIVRGLFGRQIGFKTVLGSSLKDLTFTIILPSIFSHIYCYLTEYFSILSSLLSN